MEASNLRFSERYRVIICRSHSFALPSRQACIQHLRRQHSLKDERLRAVCEEIDNSTIDLRTSHNSIRPADGGLPVDGLTVFQAYQCTVAACTGGPNALSRGLDTLKRHLSQVHAVGRLKPTKFAPSMIRTVAVQTFFPPPFTQLFIVDPEQVPAGPRAASLASSQSDATSSPSDETTSNQIPDSLLANYRASQEDWQAGFDGLSSDTALHESQTPPWLSVTGIAPFLQRLTSEKADIRALLWDPSDSTSK